MANLLTASHFYSNNVSKFVTEQDGKEFIKVPVPYIGNKDREMFLKIYDWEFYVNRDAAKISFWGTRLILGKEYECQIGDNYTSWGSKWRHGMWFNE